MVPEDLRTTVLPGDAASTSTAAAATTGRWIVTFADAEDESANLATLHSVGVSNVASSRDFEGQAVRTADIDASDAVVFAELGIAVVSAPPSQAPGIRSDSGGAVVSVEPEYVHHVLTGPYGAEYVQGYRDGVTDFSARLLTSAGAAGVEQAATSQSWQDSAEFSWGLQATGVSTGQYGGQGIRIAILDTGFTFDHPDFADRNITSQSFVPGAATAQDGHGHGTHCVGTACGPKNPTSGVRRYGCACEADILVGKVLDDEGSGTDTNILAGINWALGSGAHIVSMSLGANVPRVSRAYETVGRRALRRDCLIVAAAGNNARRDQTGLPPEQQYGFVGIPANSPSILAVAALDGQAGIGYFSARSLPHVRGGSVDIAGPGVDVFSSWNQPRPEQGNQLYRSISGTSMATPHVAGIAALWCEATQSFGSELWVKLTQQAQRLQLPSVDIGSGLVQAPH